MEGRAYSTLVNSRSSPRYLRRHLGDKSCAALESDVVPQPGECDDEAIACRDQEIDVHHAPEQPAKEAGELDPAELHHRGLAADGGEGSGQAAMACGFMGGRNGRSIFQLIVR